MTIKNLNKEQVYQLKQRILCEKIENITYGELANADSLISDLEVEEEFGGVTFVPEDFI